MCLDKLEQVSLILTEINSTINSKELSWEDKYENIFSEKILKEIEQLEPSFLPRFFKQYSYRLGSHKIVSGLRYELNNYLAKHNKQLN